MELQFERSAVSFLNPLVQEVRSAEQTQEIKLPDSMPDIGRIIAAWGQGILRGKEWRREEVSLSCGMMVWVLYAPEDGSPERCIDTWIPFLMKWDIPAGDVDGVLRMTMLPRPVDARSVSPRKIMVRAGMSAMAEAWLGAEQEICTQEGEFPDMELLRSTYPVRLPVEAGERTFLLDEELTLPASAPVPEGIIYYRLDPRLTDKRVLGNKILFRGNGNLHVLYRSQEGQLHSWDFELPFSQYAQLDAERGTEALVDVLVSPTSLELTLEPGGQLRLKAGLAGQYLVSDLIKLPLVEDAYSPGRAVQLQKQTLELPVQLEKRRENLYGEQTLSAEANLTADVSFSPEFPRQRQTAEGVEMELPGVFQVLYYGEDGVLRSGTARWEGSQSIPADENTRITAMPLSAQPQATAGNGQIQLKSDIPLEMTSTARQEFSMVTGAQLGEAVPKNPDRPTLILRRVGNSSLWDIAKENGSTLAAIRSANNLQSSPEPNQMLLIPVS